MKTLIIGNTLTSALKKLTELCHEYRQYGIEIINSHILTDIIILDYNNNETISAMSFFRFKQLSKEAYFDNIHFDRNISQKEFFNIIDNYLQSPSTMWQF
jgi:hypothetical protein